METVPQFYKGSSFSYGTFLTFYPLFYIAIILYFFCNLHLNMFLVFVLYKYGFNNNNDNIIIVIVITAVIVVITTSLL